MATEYEREYVTSRAEAGALLRRLGVSLDGGDVRLGGEDDPTVDVPERVTVALEFEADGDERELEVELTWQDDGAVAESASEGDSARDERPDDADQKARADDGEDGPVGDAPADGPAALDSGGDVASGGRARFELFRDRADEWRWRLVHDNGEIIADSGEGYTRKENAKKGLRSVMANAPGATVEERD